MDEDEIETCISVTFVEDSFITCQKLLTKILYIMKKWGFAQEPISFYCSKGNMKTIPIFLTFLSSSFLTTHSLV